MVVGDTLAHHARNDPDGEALVFRDRRLTWRELDEGANRVANAVLEQGAEHGDPVLLLLDNSVAFVECYYGLAKIGCVSAPLVPNTVAREAGDVAESLDPALVIADADGADLALEIADRLDSSPGTIGVGEGHDLAHDYRSLSDHAPADEPGVEVHPDDRFTVKFTSGTTGAPKGCVRTHRNFVMAASIALIELPITGDDVGLIPTPLAAGFGISMLTTFVYRGTSTVLLPEFDPGAYLDAIEREEVTVATAMEPLVQRIMEHPRFDDADLSSLRLFHGVNPPEMAAELGEQETFRAGFTSGYASSEAGGLVTFKTPEDYDRELASDDRELGSLGREGVLTRVECLDDDRNVLERGETGELAVRGPSVFQGYWDRPGKTDDAFEDGWLLTGDVGFKDEAGYVYLLGRKDDRIGSGGLNVYPAEVETVLQTRENVRDAAVLGVPDPEWGERVVACVVPAGECSAEELDDYCRDELAAHKRPKQYVFVDSLPQNDVGKIRKGELEEIALEEADR